MESQKDKEILRSLAKEVKQIAADPVQEKNRVRWSGHNSLKNREPLLLIFPEGSWSELIPEKEILCQDPLCRQVERYLRQRIFTFRNLKDDQPIEGDLVVNKMIAPFDWGLQEKKSYTDSDRGSYHLDPVLLDKSDLKKIHTPEVIYLENETLEKADRLEGLVGDILPVKLKGKQHISFHMAAQYNNLRGVDNFLLDFYLEPALFHGAMEKFTTGWQQILKAYESENLLSLNNDGTYHNSGGNGYLEGELPGKDFDPAHVRLKDMWGSSESQEFAPIGPDHHWEFALQYEIELLKEFGLTGYGCCEDLTNKLDYVKKIPRIRRISCSPWADIPQCAASLKGDYILSWKPDPAILVGNFDEKGLRNNLREGLEACKQQGAIPEIILKDTHTCEHKPERFYRWREIYREAVSEVYT
jgi:hypothetical protein